MEAVTLNRSRPFGELYGHDLDNPKAKYEQDNVYFDVAGNLLPGQHHAGAPAPEAGQAQAVPQVTVIGRDAKIDVSGEPIAGLRQLDDWMNGLTGAEGRSEALKYAKEELKIELPASSKLVVAKQLIRSLYIAKATYSDAPADA